MKAALLAEYHRPLELVDRPVPEPGGPRDVVVRVGGAGVCATDLHAIDGLMEPAGLRPPVVLGHENAGWVHAVGDGVTAAAVGDAVLVYPAYTCGVCVPCRRGRDMHCVRHGFTGLTRDGGFAEFVLVDERSLVPLPAGVEPVEVAPHADAGVTAMHAVKKLLPRLGPGTHGRADRRGRRRAHRPAAREVPRSVDGRRDRHRRAAAPAGGRARRRRGDRRREGRGEVRELRGAGVDVVIDFVGTDVTHAAGIEMLAKGGVYSAVGYGGTVSIPSVALVAQDLGIEGNLVGNWIDLWELLQLHGRGQIVLRTETHRLDDVNDVLDRLREGEITGRAVLVP